MSATSRELVLQALEFRNPCRAPRQLWALPWAHSHHPQALEQINADFPPDITGAPASCRTPSVTRGNPYEVGFYTDEWGCVFENRNPGIIGEVKEPLVHDWETECDNIHVPREWLTVDTEPVNRFCAGSDKFVLAGICPRPFEQLQFIRMTENLYLDLLDPPARMLGFMNEMHEFYCELIKLWCTTDVDGISFMDDWGSQNTLLIHPELWREYFRPMYRDYIQIAHAAGKKTFMHSDGHILAIYPDLVELGLDAVNSQLFCMGLENLAPYAGRITFWGEIDRQHLLPRGSMADIDRAVREVHRLLWRNGGCVAQCEFGAGARPENVRQVFTTWDELTSTHGGR